MWLSRPREALAACRAGDTLVVTKLDRLARSLPDARATADELTQRQTSLPMAGRFYDPTDAVGRLLLNILAKVAAFESGLIRLRTARACSSPRPRVGSAASCPSSTTGKKLIPSLGCTAPQSGNASKGAGLVEATSKRRRHTTPTWLNGRSGFACRNAGSGRSADVRVSGRVRCDVG
jgi:hypothetical protein